MAVYVIEVKVRVASDREEWRAVRPSAGKMPYLFESWNEADDMRERLYGSPEVRHKARVTEINTTGSGPS